VVNLETTNGTIGAIKVSAFFFFFWRRRRDTETRDSRSLRGHARGSILGRLPGGGPDAWRHYPTTSGEEALGHPEEFGKGAVEGWPPGVGQHRGGPDAFIPMLTSASRSNAVLALMVRA